MMDDEQAWPGVGCQRCELFGCRVILCAKRAPVLGQPGEHLQRACLMNQYVTAVTSVDRLFRRTGIARDDEAAVRRVESVPLAFQCVFRGERGDGDLCVPIDDAGLDFMSIRPPAVRVAALVSFRVRPRVDVNPIGL